MSTNKIIVIVVSCVLGAVAIVAISLFTIFKEVTDTTSDILRIQKSLDSALEETKRFQDSMANDPFLKSLDSNSF